MIDQTNVKGANRMTTTPPPEKKERQPSLKRKKRKNSKKKSDSMTKAEIRKVLGIKKEPKPKINRKKFAVDVIDRWDKKQTNAYQLAQDLTVALSYQFGRIKHKTSMKPDLWETNRITDEDMGILKLINTALLLRERQDDVETYGDLWEVFEEGFLERKEVSSDVQATE